MTLTRPKSFATRPRVRAAIRLSRRPQFYFFWPLIVCVENFFGGFYISPFSAGIQRVQAVKCQNTILSHLVKS